MGMGRSASVRTTKTLTDKTKMGLSWALLRPFAESQVLVKRYLLSQVRSRFLEINPQDWKTAALLPIERFTGSPKTEVYKKSLSSMVSNG